jgi:hypothetical protein
MELGCGEQRGSKMGQKERGEGEMSKAVRRVCRSRCGKR